MPTIPRDQLNALVAIRRDPTASLERAQRIPYPGPAGVLYAGPNPDGTAKACRNCWKWSLGGACAEVAGDIEPGQVCGYHVFGKPQASLPIGAPEKKLSPTDAGLVATPNDEGTSCSSCRFFQVDFEDVAGGLCNAVGSLDGLPPVAVDSMGCCARWELQPRIE